jgi:serine O-acetyltransferase
MPAIVEKLNVCDPIWTSLRAQAEEIARTEPTLASFAHATILKHARLEDALSYHLARKIGDDDVSPMLTREIFEEALSADPAIGEAVRADLSAIFDRDPACHSHAQAFLFFKGFHSLESYRVAHWLWRQGRKPLAYFIQRRWTSIPRRRSGAACSSITRPASSSAKPPSWTTMCQCCMA